MYSCVPVSCPDTTNYLLPFPWLQRQCSYCCGPIFCLTVRYDTADHVYKLGLTNSKFCNARLEGAPGSIFGWGTMLQAGRSRVGFSMRLLDFFSNWFNPSSRRSRLGSTQPLAEMSTRNLPGGNLRYARKADNLTSICGPTLSKIRETRSLKTAWVSTACYRDSFTFLSGRANLSELCSVRF
jgi:hypothetical protein